MNRTPSGGWRAAMSGFARSFLSSFAQAVRRGSEAPRSTRPPRTDRDRRRAVPHDAAPAPSASPGRSGDAATRDLTHAEIQTLRPSYEPRPDGDPDPGEVVWTWVPYAENDGRGKDRPVLIIARIDAGITAGCFLSTKQHPGFVSVGTGGWDAQGRDSYLAPERVLRVTDAGMRREGHVLDRERFIDAVAAVVRRHGLRT